MAATNPMDLYAGFAAWMSDAPKEAFFGADRSAPLARVSEPSPPLLAALRARRSAIYDGAIGVLSEIEMCILHSADEGAEQGAEAALAELARLTGEKK